MKKPRKITEIIIHNSATKDSDTVSWSAIRRYHTVEKGWSDIGYHVGLEKVGSRYEALIGRPWTRSGAHTRGRNALSLGVCIVGDFNRTRPSRACMEAAVGLVAMLAQQLRIPAGRIRGHREVAKNRTCPGKNFDMVVFRQKVAARIG